MPKTIITIISALILSTSLSSCTNTNMALDPSLTAPMNIAGAKLDRQKVISIINQYRATSGASPLILNEEFNQSAHSLALKYANSETIPKTPKNVDTMQISAGYNNIANTFSGWRNANSAKALSNPAYKKAGIGVYYKENSTHGTYWVLLLSK